MSHQPKVSQSDDRQGGESSHAQDDLGVLRAVAEGTARTVGGEFFPSLVAHLARAMNVAYSFVAEFSGSPARVRTLGFCGHGKLLDNIEYDLAGTPCEDVASGKLCHHPRGVIQKFPLDKPLEAMGVESYLGVPLTDRKGRILGHLAVLDTKPMPEEPQSLSVFQIFAARAAAELERAHMEQSLIESEKRFRDLFDEAPVGYVYEDTQTRFISANRAAMNLLGIKPEEVKDTVGLNLVAPTEEAQARVHESLAAEQAGQEKKYIEIELRRKDNGQSVWIQRYSRPEPDGKHTRTMLIDITERVLAERERNRLRQQNLYLREEIEAEYNFEEIIGSAPPLRAALAKVKQVAPTDATVLILGETGTGKELIARAIHNLSPRRDKPLIKLNCSALPTGLIESELFGHEKGAFTGALEKRIGRFTLADGGTIFLDEIGDVPADVQVRLLRVLQEKEFEPVGSTKTHRVDVRVIAATNRNLAEAIEAGDFRSDLYYRLNVFPIALPALRDRPEDIELLARFFADRIARRVGKAIDDISPDSLERLQTYNWPGNVRELENIIERAVILSGSPALEVPREILQPGESPAVNTTQRRNSKSISERKVQSKNADNAPATLEDSERRHITDALNACGWMIEGKTGAAGRLGLNPSTLRSRMKKLGITRPGS